MPEPRKLTLYPSSMTSAEWSEVEPAVRNSAFFSATVEDERLLSSLQKLVEKGIAEGWSMQNFVDEALRMLDNISLDPDARAGDTFREDFETLYNVDRLRLIFRTQTELAAGYAQFCKEFSPISLQVYPGWKFVRQPGAKEEHKRFDHVRTENFIRLKTDIKFWLRRNRAEIGGFGNPYTPWGFNSWMRTNRVSREACEKLGLLKPGEKVTVPAEYAKWGIGNAVQSMGRAGVSDLSEEQQKRVVDRCAEEGITVQKVDDKTLQVTPDKDNPEDPLTQLDEKALDAWAEAELDKLTNMSDEDLMKELLGE